MWKQLHVVLFSSEYYIHTHTPNYSFNNLRYGVTEEDIETHRKFAQGHAVVTQAAEFDF